MNYTSLVADKNTAGSIARWVNSSILDVQAMLDESQSLIYQGLRCREMIVSGLAFPVATGDYSLALPSGFLDPISFRNIQGFRLHARDLPSVENRRTYDASGVLQQADPANFAITGTTLELDCACGATSAGNFILSYYGKPALLSSGNQTNFLTDRYPHVLRTAILAMAADYMDNEQRYERYAQRLIAMLADLQMNDDLALRGGQVDSDYSEAI